MSSTTQALMQQTRDPAGPSGGTQSPPTPARTRETASVLIGRILNPATMPPAARPSRGR